MLRKIYNRLKRSFASPVLYSSETSKVRHLVLDYCNGYGCDVGFGGDKIKKQSVGVDYKKPYAFTGHDKVDIACDIMKSEIPVPDDTFDYVYTSHLIEDFLDTEEGLRKLIRPLKNGGNLILVFPDQKKYEQHCITTNQPINEHHKHAEMGLDYMRNCLDRLANISYTIFFQSNCDIDYNVVLVAKIHKNGQAK